MLRRPFRKNPPAKHPKTSVTLPRQLWSKFSQETHEFPFVHELMGENPRQSCYLTNWPRQTALTAGVANCPHWSWKKTKHVCAKSINNVRGLLPKASSHKPRAEINNQEARKDITAPASSCSQAKRTSESNSAIYIPFTFPTSMAHRPFACFWFLQHQGYTANMCVLSQLLFSCCHTFQSCPVLKGLRSTEVLCVSSQSGKLPYELQILYIVFHSLSTSKGNTEQVYRSSSCKNKAFEFRWCKQPFRTAFSDIRLVSQRLVKSSRFHSWHNPRNQSLWTCTEKRKFWNVAITLRDLWQFWCRCPMVHIARSNWSNWSERKTQEKSEIQRGARLRLADASSGCFPHLLKSHFHVPASDPKSHASKRYI